jgi:tRNA G18 (ribose-2'-O)-methylase SpoU
VANIIEISDLSQPELKCYSELTDAKLREDSENKAGIFIAESPKVIERALNAGCRPISFLMDRRHIEGDAHAIIERCPSIPVYTADSTILQNLTGFRLTRGVLCAMYRPTLPSVQSICKDKRRIAILEDVTESTNVGAIFRSAAALKIDAVLVTPGCCSPLCRRSVRVSMGTIFQVPWTIIGNTKESWPLPGITEIKSLGFKTVAMALSDNSVSIDNKQLCSEPKLAIVLGTEGDGLCPNTIAQCDYVARIPMALGVDSLNVAAAAAVGFWQLRV